MGLYLTLSTLSNSNRLFKSLFWKRSVGVKGLIISIISHIHYYTDLKPLYYFFISRVCGVAGLVVGNPNIVRTHKLIVIYTCIALGRSGVVTSIDVLC